MKHTQFLRRCELFLVNASETLDLSNFKIRFSVVAEDNETPNTARIRVYNLSDATVRRAVGEFTRVILQAGYQNGNYGVVFDGTVKQFRRGRESNVDSFLDIFGGDGDTSYNFGFINESIQAGSSAAQRLERIAAAMELTLDPNAGEFVTGGILPRGKVLFNLGRAYARNLAQTHGCRWSIQGGVLTVVPLTGYLPSDIVDINSSTGMVGVPEATDNGITVTCLLNPNIIIGGRVRINNRDITETTVKEQGFPSYTDIALPASLSNDGVYRVIVAEHEGDTRSQTWYSRLTCLSVDASAEPQQSVKAYG